jgi:hypothetical protein
MIQKTNVTSGTLLKAPFTASFIAGPLLVDENAFDAMCINAYLVPRFAPNMSLFRCEHYKAVM